MDGVPVVDGGFLHLVAPDERDVLLGRGPGPHRVAAAGRPQDPDQPVGPGPEVLDQACTRGLGRPAVRSWGGAQTLLSDGGPEPVDLGQVPDEIGDGPARAVLHLGVQIAIGRRREAGAVLGDRLGEVEGGLVHRANPTAQRRHYGERSCRAAPYRAATAFLTAPVTL